MTPTRTASGEGTLLARVDREVTTLLRNRHANRWRFSRVHRPAPDFRTVPDPKESGRGHAVLRVVAGAPSAEQTASHARIDRRTGAIERAVAIPAGVPAKTVWQPLAPPSLRTRWPNRPRRQTDRLPKSWGA